MTEVIRRSRFQTDLAPAAAVEEARAFIDHIRSQAPGATHHCWAYLVGSPGTTANVGYSDDGEPHGTAGQPMLTALIHSGVGDVVAVSTRHYGGVKLGTGGLARAYSGGVKRALEALTTTTKVTRIATALSVAYPSVDAIKRMAAELDVEIEEEEYGARPSFRLGVPEHRWEAFLKAVADVTGGRGVVERL